MTRAGGLSLGQESLRRQSGRPRPRCGISSHGVASSQFRGPGLRADCLAEVGPDCFHRLAGLPAYPHVDTPTAGTRKPDGGVPKVLNPHVDAQIIDVWKHTRTISQMLSRRVDAERLCVSSQ